MGTKKAVNIEFDATQKAGGEEACVRQQLSGVRGKEKGDVVLLFSENWEGVEEEVHTALFVKEDSVIVKREGPVRTEMEFQRDSDTMCEYETGVGTLNFVITTKELKILLTEDLISIRIAYEMFANGNPVSENTLYVEAR